MSDIEQKLRNLASKWQHANNEVYEVCRDAAEELRVLNLKLEVAVAKKQSILDAYEHGRGWGKGKDE